MSEQESQSYYVGNRTTMKVFGALIVGVAIIYLSVLLAAHSFSTSGSVLVLFLASLLALTALVPAIISMRMHSNRFDFFHPLFYFAWIFFIPQFSLASFLIMFGVMGSYAEVVDASAISRALIYMIMGSIGLSAGYFLPIGKKIGNRLPSLKEFSLPVRELRFPAFLFLIIGGSSLIVAFIVGIFGYQYNFGTSVFATTYFSFSRLIVIGQVIIWYAFFRRRQDWLILVFFSLGMTLFIAVMSGSRGTLFNATIIAFAGYQYSRDKLQLTNLVKWGLLIVLFLSVGMIFWTQFRLEKTQSIGRATNISIGEQLSLSSSTIPEVKSNPNLSSLLLNTLIDRTNGVTSLSVIVTNAERLKSNEIEWDMDNNIVRDLQTAFIPRFLFPSKPTVGVNEKIGNLYFSKKFHSPETTYIGDLYRNFRVWGIIPGMMLIGITFRIFYAWLIERQLLSPLRVGIFMVLGLSANLEALYSTYYPSLIRVATVIISAVFTIKICHFISLEKSDEKI